MTQGFVVRVLRRKGNQLRPLRFGLAGLFLAVLALAGSLVTREGASADPQRTASSQCSWNGANVHFFVFDQFSNEYALDIPNLSRMPGTQAIIWPYNGGANQTFWLQATSSDCAKFRIHTSFNGVDLCLNVNHNSLDQGAQIIQWYCDNPAPENEQFYMSLDTSSTHIVPASTTHGTGQQCLEPSNNVVAGHGVIQWHCNNITDFAELWTVV